MSKPTKILDANDLIKIYGDPVNTEAGDKALSDLAEEYDVRTTSTVLQEIGDDAPEGKQIPRGWFQENNAVIDTSAYDQLPKAQGKGERSIKSVIDPDYADGTVPESYYDSQYDYRDPDVKVVSDDKRAFPGDYAGTRQSTNEFFSDYLNQKGVPATLDVDGRLKIGDTLIDVADLVGKGASLAGKLLTPIGLLIALTQAANAADNGDYDGAINILAEFGAGEVGGGLTAAGAGILAAKLLQNVPNGYAKIAGIILAGILGGLVGDSAGQAAYEEAVDYLKKLGIIPDDLFDDLVDGVVPDSEIPSLRGGDEPIPEPIDNLPVDGVGGLPPQISPLVVDLDRDGSIELVSLENSTTWFDFWGDGFAEKMGWVSPDDGILVHDLDGNGIIEAFEEMFGSGNDTHSHLSLFFPLKRNSYFSHSSFLAH